MPVKKICKKIEETCYTELLYSSQEKGYASCLTVTSCPGNIASIRNAYFRQDFLSKKQNRNVNI